MNSMEINKIAAAILTAGVVAMLLGLAAKLIIPDHAAHSGDHGPNMFADLAPAPDSGEPAAPAGPEPIAAFLASASIEEGEQVAKKCVACHTFEAGGINKVGPNLANMVGADKAAGEFAYSAALEVMEGDWTYENLNEFLYKPRDYVPGTKMSFPGLRNPEDRAAVIAYMRSFTDNPPPLPDPAAAVDPEAGAVPEGSEGAPTEGGEAASPEDETPRLLGTAPTTSKPMAEAGHPSSVSAMLEVSPDWIDLAERAANLSRPILRRYFRSDLSIIRKGDESPVTRADREAEAAIRQLLGREVPDHGIIGEEHGTEREDADYVWVLDPLDGTRAFVVGKPTFGTLIALAHKGHPILGVIDAPILGERWIGVAGQPTTMNGRPATTRTCTRLAEAWINTTSPEMFAGRRAEQFTRLRDASAGCNYGGDCYGYGLLASGCLDLVIEAEMQSYDYMALAPVVEGAGGVITDWAGRPLRVDSDGTVLAAGDARVHAAAVALLADS